MLKTRYCLLPALMLVSVFMGFNIQKAQVLSGYVYLLRGNQMPAPGRPLSKGHGISRDIYIFEPTNSTQAAGTPPLFLYVRTKLIVKTHSDSTGHYIVTLPPGRYSVFIGESGKYFSAESDDNGILTPVTVPADKPVEKNLTLNYNAVY